jgi:hypothetical protein
LFGVVRRFFSFFFHSIRSVWGQAVLQARQIAGIDFSFTTILVEPALRRRKANAKRARIVARSRSSRSAAQIFSHIVPHRPLRFPRTLSRIPTFLTGRNCIEQNKNNRDKYWRYDVIYVSLDD